MHGGSVSETPQEAPRRSPVPLISLYGCALAVVAAVLYVTVVHGTEPLDHPYLPWWSIAMAWIVAEACVVHLHFRRSRHSFSLADLPFVFALAFASGNGFLAGALVGATIAYLLR